MGDTVEFEEVKTTRPLVPGRFWQIWTFPQRMIALDGQLDLNVPLDRAIHGKSPAGVEPSISTPRNRRLYHWAKSNLKTPPPVDIFTNLQFDAIRLHRSGFESDGSGAGRNR